MHIIRVETTASTNILLKELANSEQLEEGTALITRTQTSGRGQAGTSWESEPGKNLTFSVLLYPNQIPVGKNFLISQLVALSILEVLEAYIGEVRIKWPNDIYFQDKKIAGVLIENEITGNEFSQSIIGIGLNVNQESFQSELPNPISLKQITGTDTETENLLEQILRRLMSRYQSLKAGMDTDIAAAYYASLYRNAGYHFFKDKNGTFIACIEGVGDDGALLLKTDDGEHRQYTFKEVSFC